MRVHSPIYRANSWVGALLAAAVVTGLSATLFGCPGGAALTAQFGADVRLGEVDLLVQFSDLSTEGRAAIDTWRWEFGDGSTSTEENPAHTYATPGVYTVSLTVEDRRGSTHTVEKPNYVSALGLGVTGGTFPGEEQTFGGIDFVWVPDGTFDMGNSSENILEPDALPIHTVTISRGFWMSKYEITQAQWVSVMGSNVSHFRITETEFDLPVENVSWDDAQAFITALNAAETGSAVYRLPTEAEWEYACRAGTTTDFHYGDDADDSWEYGWTWLNARYSTYPPGLLLPNAWGLYDMHGNVWEWCQDRYGEAYYETSPATDPTGSDTGPFRVARGGSWYHTPHAAFSGARFGFLSGTRYHFIGFRIVRQ